MSLPSPKLLIPIVLIGAGVAAVRFWPESPLDVTVSQASVGLVEASVANTRSGTVKACQRSRLSLPLGGQVSVLYVAQGDKVEAGAPLMELWNEDIRATLATAEVNAEIGEYATPSPPGVATPPAIDLINPDCFYVQAPIDEVDAAQVALDMPVRVTLDAFGDRTFDGHVSRISPYIQDEEKQARTVDVDVRLNELPDGIHLLIGYSADIEVITATSDNTLRLPTELLIDTDHVMLAKHGHAVKQQVELGLTNWTWSEVISGVSEDDLIINEPGQSDLTDGRTVRVLDTIVHD